MSHTVHVHFGAMSLVLGFGALQGVVVMLLLLRSKRNVQRTDSWPACSGSLSYGCCRT